ncbi:M23 family metallopeptidase [Desmospora profundinema]|uniref:Murein DD-endopeptidase MepM/ murein hydrolase activator NlpD n=1 Tax=Desmospora profundinema TaxID=1571184 RepID=A0ABU1IMU9_9BACL|nr:M23 family metallopeptidase [Desmospora profundinema]MDR6225489.1 murein DD-endopeptidase MepM/ murein hydrolase activator NlpD [Desmospora profundinema]
MSKNGSKWAFTSLSVCTASASVVVGGTHGSAEAAEPALQPPVSDLQKERVAHQVVYQYLNPISSVADGNLAVETEKKPLMVEVKPGETLYQIGREYGVPDETLARYNDISDPRLLQSGSKIKIPVVMERIRVKEGDTLESIAEHHDVGEIALKKANPDLKLAEDLYVGQILTIPQAYEPELKEEPKQESVQTVTLSRKGQTSLSSSGTQSQNRQSIRFQWPVTGQITSGYGWRNGSMHTGIDIWNQQRENNVIKAAKGGTVVRAGYAGGYGNLVVLDHGEGWTTYYAHLSRITVAKGNRVEQGSGLGYMGSTGNSTGVHLHFEVRKNDQPMNPLNVLP